MSVPPEAPTLEESDVRAVVRLLGEVCSLPGGHTEKKRRLMDGLCQLIGADAWVWTLACQYETDKPPVYIGFMNGGFDEEQFPKYLAAVEHPASAGMTIPFINEVREHQSQPRAPSSRFPAGSSHISARRASTASPPRRSGTRPKSAR